MSRILIVDDEPSVLHAFRDMLLDLGHDVQLASGGEEGLRCVLQQDPELIVTDLSMPGMDGFELFRRVRATNPKLPVIIMTGQGTMHTAIEATKLGAFDYQLKPFEPEAMLAAIARALESVRLMRRSVAINPEVVAVTADAIVGRSAEMQEVFKAIGRVAATDATVLIRGESGTGKELVARAIYQHSLRAAEPLRVVNCAAIPEPLLESELFGYERGAFTGAHARKIGKFEQAHGGTIFLDEIGDVPPSVQAKLLRVLQQRTIERVGGNETIHADVRVLAATNRNLEQAIANGNFREDLFHRLNVFAIHIPQLRERSGDIPHLVHYFLQRYSDELKIDRPPIAEEAMQMLCAHSWPGNVRELEHCIYRILILNRGYPVQALDVERARETSLTGTDGEQAPPVTWSMLIQSYLEQHSGPQTYENLMSEIDRIVLTEALHRSGGNQTHAARLLGLARPTLHAKIQRYGLDRSREDEGRG